jgi:hypothetical protein
MKLKFWKRTENAGTAQNAKLQRPKELSDRVGIYLVTQLKEDPDWIWTLRSVSRPRENNRNLHDIRIYDPHQARVNQIKVENFTTLDQHQDLILFTGFVNKDTGTVELEKTTQAAA